MKVPEVRVEACKALGWTSFEPYGNGGGFWHRNGCKERQRNSSCKCGGNWFLPEIELRPEVSEPLFLEWTVQRKLTAVMTYGTFTSIQLYDADGEEYKAPITAPTPSEARAKTIIHGDKTK